MVGTLTSLRSRNQYLATILSLPHGPAYQFRFPISTKLMDVFTLAKQWLAAETLATSKPNMTASECRFTSIFRSLWTNKSRYSAKAEKTAPRTATKSSRNLFLYRTYFRTIRKALGIGVAARFQERCILDAELVLWDDEEQRIQEFHKLRRHLKHKDGYFPHGVCNSC